MKFTHFALSSVVVVACLTGCNDDSKVVANTPQTATTAEADPVPASTSSTPDSTSSRAVVPPAAAETSPPDSRPEVKQASPDKTTFESPPLKRTKAEIKAFNEEMNKKDKDYKTLLKIPAPQTDSWVPTSVSAATIADHMQRSIPMLRNTAGRIAAVMKTPDGSGEVKQDLKIRDTKEYDVPFVLMGDQPAEAKIISNGNFKMEQVQARWQKTVKSSDPMTPFLATGYGAAFERDFSQLIFSPITKVGPGWPSVVSHWSDPSQGYTVTVEERTSRTWKDNPKYYYRDYRIHAVRSPEAAKRLGASEISVVVDGYHSLPVRIQTSYTDPATKKNWEMTWAIGYYAGQKFTSKDFAAPYNMGGKSSLPTSS